MAIDAKFVMCKVKHPLLLFVFLLVVINILSLAFNKIKIPNLIAYDYSIMFVISMLLATIIFLIIEFYCRSIDKPEDNG